MVLAPQRTRVLARPKAPLAPGTRHTNGKAKQEQGIAQPPCAELACQQHVHIAPSMTALLPGPSRHPNASCRRASKATTPNGRAWHQKCTLDALARPPNRATMPPDPPPRDLRKKRARALVPDPNPLAGHPMLHPWPILARAFLPSGRNGT
eukprot:4167230-Alexandrium_andersonii.AAC.1